MDWKKLGSLRHINRIDVWQNIFEFLDVKTVINGLSKSCKALKILSLMHISHIKSICILSLNIENKSSYISLIELLKCEKTFLLKINSNQDSQEFINSDYKNKSVIRLHYKTENNAFSSLIPFAELATNFNHIKVKGNLSLPVFSDKVLKGLVDILTEKKILYLKITKVTLSSEGFNCLTKYIKTYTPKILILDINCFCSKTIPFHHYLARLWKNKWLLKIDYKVNGNSLFQCTKEFIA